MAKALGPRFSAEQCEQLYRQHQTFLSLPNQPQLEAAFVAMVKDHYLNSKEQHQHAQHQAQQQTSTAPKAGGDAGTSASGRDSAEAGPGAVAAAGAAAAIEGVGEANGNGNVETAGPSGDNGDAAAVPEASRMHAGEGGTADDGADAGAEDEGEEVRLWQGKCVHLDAGNNPGGWVRIACSWREHGCVNTLTLCLA